MPRGRPKKVRGNESFYTAKFLEEKRPNEVAGKNFNISADNLTKSEKLMMGVKQWASFWRARPDLFIRDYLGITLKPFQKVLIYAMIRYNLTCIFASRGSGKTYLVALYCLVKCILYPGTKIVIASGKFCAA